MCRIVRSRERLPLQRDNFPNPARTAVAADVASAPIAIDFRRRQIIADADAPKKEDAELKRPANRGIGCPIIPPGRNSRSPRAPWLVWSSWDGPSYWRFVFCLGAMQTAG